MTSLDELLKRVLPSGADGVRENGLPAPLISPQDPPPRPKLDDLLAREPRQRIPTVPPQEPEGPRPTRLDQYLRQQDQLLMLSFSEAVKADPELAGEAQRLGIETGLDPLLIERNIDMVRELSRRRQLETTQLPDLPPVLRARLEQDPDFVRIAYDDLENLSFLERASNTLSELGTLVKALGQGPYVGAQALRESVIGQRTRFEKLSTERSVLAAKRMRAILNDNSAQFPDLTPAEERRMELIGRQLVALPSRSPGLISGLAGFLGQTSETADQVLGIATLGAAGGGSGGLLGGPAAPLTVTGGAIGGFFVGLGVGIATSSHDIEGGAAFLELTERGVEPRLAAKLASGVGFVNAALETAGGFGLGFAARQTVGRLISKKIAEQPLEALTTGKLAGDLIRGWAGGLASETLTEVAQEGVNIRAEVLAGLDPGDISDRLADIAVETIMTAGLISGIGPAVRLRSDITRVGIAEAQQAPAEAVLKAATQSQARPRNPVAFQAHHDAIMADVDESTTGVFIDATQMGESLRQAGINPKDLDDAVPGLSDQLREQTRLGGDVAIPLEVYTAHVADTPVDAALRQDIRYNPDLPSQREVEEFREGEAAIIEETAKLVEQDISEQDLFDKSAREVEKRMQDRIAQTQRLPPDQAEAGAAFYRELIATLVSKINEGKTTKITPDEFDKQSGMKVLGEEPSFGGQSEESLQQEARTAGFFSALQRETEGIKAKNIDAGTLKGLVNKGKVKRAEIDATGLGDFVALSETGKVSKGELQAFLDANGVTVTPVVLGAQLNQARPARFAQFGLPGGTNYREVLLTLPRAGLEHLSPANQRRVVQIDERLSQLSPALGRDAVQEIDRLHSERAAISSQTGPGFHTTHFPDHKNIVAHIRMDDRVDEQGNRVLFIEEIQSDWAQQGRKVGFTGDLASHADLAVGDEVPGLGRIQAITEHESTGRRSFDIGGLRGIPQEAVPLPDVRQRSGGVPVAPFVTSTKGWLNLALKQIMLEAVNGQYASVAFINGEQAAGFYDLRKQVHNIQVVPRTDARTGEKTRSVTVNMRERSEGMSETAEFIELGIGTDGVVDNVSPGAADLMGKPLADVVGKEMAERIMSADRQSIEGEDLAVGGEGMLAFYDKLVPQAVGKLSKKLGGPKVGTVDIDSGETVPTLQISTVTRGAIGRNEGQRQTMFQVVRVVDGVGTAQSVAVATREEAERDLRDLQEQGVADAGTQPPDKQAGLEVTDEITQAIQDQGGLPLFQDDRGKFFKSTLTTALLQPDASTFFHEATHYYATTLVKLASQPDAPAAITDQMDTLLEWWGIEGETFADRLATWNAMDIEQQRPHDEALAFNFEDWLSEGNAPSIKLETLFQKIRRWLINIYKDVRGALNAEYRRQFGVDLPVLTGPLRQFMDRMLATDEQIAEAEAINSMLPMFKTQDQAGYTDARWEQYTKAQEEAHESSVTNLAHASEKQLEWLRGKVRNEVKAQIAKEVPLQPVYRAQTFLKKGVLLDEEGVPTVFEGSHKMDVDSVRDLLPEGVSLRAMPGTTTQGGLDPDSVSGMFGFDSGDALVQALVEAPTIPRAIEAATDARMTEMVKDPDHPQHVSVDRALRTQARARFVALEWKFLAQSTQPVRAVRSAARKAALSALGDTPVGEIKQWRYAAAEGRAARQAEKASSAGDADTARRSKLHQLLQNQLAREAAKVEAEVSKDLRLFKKVNRKDKAIGKGRDIDLVRASRKTLEAVGLSPVLETAPQRELTAQSMEVLRKSFPAMHERVLAVADAWAGREYKAIPLDAFREIADTATGLWNLARTSQLVEIEGKQMEFGLLIFQLEEQLQALPRRKAKGALPPEGITPSDSAKTIMDGWHGFAGLKRMQHYARFLDGGKERGAFESIIVRQMLNQIKRWRTHKRDLNGRLIVKVRAMVKDLGAAWDAKVAAPTLNHTFRGWREIVDVLLDMGNPSNMEKRFVGEGWSVDPRQTESGELDTSAWDAFWDSVKHRMPESVVDFVTTVWSEFAELLPLAQETQRAVRGFEFPALEISDWDTGTEFGIVPGGYAPVRVDRHRARQPRTQSVVEGLEGIDQAYDYSRMPTTGAAGFTLPRNPNYHDRLTMDISDRMNAFDAELRFIYLQPHVSAVLRIVKNRSFAEEMNTYDRDAINGIILPWLDTTARQITSRPSSHPIVDKAATFLRSSGSMVILGFNWLNAWIQQTGIINAMTEVKARTFLRHGLLKEPFSAWAEASRKSEFMRAQMDMAARKTADDLALIGKSWPRRTIKGVRRAASRWAFFPQRIVQGFVNVATWHARYQQSIAEAPVGMDMEEVEKRAIDDADLAVERAQGSNNPESLAAYETTIPAIRLFTQFSTFSNMLLNQILTRGQTRTKLALNAVWILTAISLYESVLRAMLDGMPEDDEGDGYADELAAVFARNMGRNALGMVPFFGPGLLSAAEGEGDRLASAPGVTALADALRGVDVVGQILTGEEITGYEIRNLGALMTLATGLPVMPIAKALGYYQDVELGRVRPTSEFDRVRGLVTGRASEASRR